MSLIKIILYISLIGCCGLIGYKLSYKYQIRVEELLAIKSRLATLESQIVFFQSPLAQALKQSTTRENKEIDKILNTVSQELLSNNKGQSFCVIWTETIGRIGRHAPLKSAELKALSQLGDFIENTHHDQQEKGFKQINELISRQYDQAEEERKKNQMLYLKLSLLVGIALVICLV